MQGDNERMNDRNKRKHIKKLIQKTMDTVGLNLKIKQQRTGINMSYNFIGEYVGYDVKRVTEARNEFFSHISLDSYIKTFTLHELGHALDQSTLIKSLPQTIKMIETKRTCSLHEQYNNLEVLTLIIEEHLMNIAFEETAWLNARKLNRLYHVVDWDSFDELNKHGLSTYTTLYQRDLSIYNNLMTTENIAIA